MDKTKQQEREKSSLVKKHWVRLTRACNNKCIFCLDKEPQNGSVLTMKQIKKDFSDGLKKGCQQVILSGGEATIHPSFLEIVALAKKMGYKKIQVITNGRMFSYKKFLEAAVDAGVNEITFSLHGHNSALHDLQTGIAGSFNQATKGLVNALKNPRLIVNIDIVINKNNYKQLANVMKFYIELGVGEFDLLQIIPFGRAWDNRKNIFYNIEQAMPYLKKAFVLSKKENLFIWTNRFPAQYLEKFEWLIQNPKKIIDEVRGRQKLFSDYLKTGKMLECYPKRCHLCFLESFCRDLTVFRKKKQLQSKNSPRCFVDQGKKTAEILNYDKNVNINVFADFYIKYRYFVKSKRCFACRENKHCQGAHINIIRQKGFKILKPIK